MSKRAIVGWSLAGLAALAPGFILLFSASLTLAARQPQYGVGDSYGRTMLVLLIAGAVLLLVGFIVELVAWVFAVRHASALADGRWTTALLWGGVVGILTIPLFGVGLMILGSALTAYLVVAPEHASAEAVMTVPSKPVIVKRGTEGWVLTAPGMLLALAVPNLLTNPGRPLHGALWPSLALVAAFWAMAGVGAVLVGVAWWGALFNSYRLEDKAWFRRLRWTGIAGVLTLPLLGLGALILFAVFVPYARWAPDGTVTSTGPPRSTALAA